MDLSDVERRLMAAIQDGLPLVPRPYAAVGEDLGLSEAEVIGWLSRLMEMGVIKRMGVVVRHRELGYRANAMVVWDVPDSTVADVGRRMVENSRVTLCYRRPRRPPAWPYNLFCMIHGRDRASVYQTLEALAKHCGLGQCEHRVLFSRRRFKQCGAHYFDAVRTGRDETRHGEPRFAHG